MFRLRYIGRIAILIICFVAPLTAQERADSTIRLEECVVTGAMMPRTLRSTPVMTQVLTSQDIAQINPRSVSDILQMAIPGIELTQHGAQTRVRVQGMSAEHILFMLDGEPIHSEGNGSVDLSRIDMANIERIEIVRGAASALYGSSAMGGAINFISRQLNKPLTTKLSIDYGSEGLWRTHALLGSRLGSFSSQSTINYNHQAKYKLRINSDEPFDVRGSDTWVLGEKLSYQSRNQTWRIVANFSGSRRTLHWDEKIKYLYDGYDIGGRIAYSPHHRHSAFLSYNASGYGRTQYFFTARDNRYLNLFDLTTHRGRGQYNFGQEGRDVLLLNTGFDFVWETVSGERIQNDGKRFNSSAIALYGQAEWRALPYLSATFGFRQDIHSDYGFHFSPRATLLFKQKSWRFRLSYSEGFRSPTTKELYMDWDHRGIFRLKGNSQLRPENSRMFALAPEFQVGKNFNVTFLSAYNQIYNRIFNREEEGGLVRRFRNSEDVSEIWQAQMSLRWRLNPNWVIRTDYAYVRDRVWVESKKQGRLPASTVRPHNLTYTMSYIRPWRLGRWSIDASLRCSGGVEVAVFSEALADYQLQRYEPYAIVRVGSSWTYKALRATIGIDNLLNYQPSQLNVSSTFSPGMTFFSSISLSI